MSNKTRKKANKAGKLMKCDGQMLKKVIEAKGYKCHELSKMLRYCSDYLTTCCRQNQISDVAAKYLMDYKIFPQMYDLEGEIKVEEPKEVKIDKDERKYIESDKKATDDLKKKMDMNIRNSTYGIPKETAFYTNYGIVCSEKDLRTVIKLVTSPEAPLSGSNLVAVRDILEKAYSNGLAYNLEDMRNDLLVYATKVKNPENWVRFVERLNLVNNNDSLYESAKAALNAKTCQKSPFDPTAQEIKKVLNEKYGKLEKGIDYGYGPGLKYPSYANAGHKITEGLFQFMQAAMNDLKHDREFKELIKQAVKEAYEEL